MKIFTFSSCAFKAGLEIIIIIKEEAFSFGEAVPWFLLFFFFLWVSSKAQRVKLELKMHLFKSGALGELVLKRSSMRRIWNAATHRLHQLLPSPLQIKH